MKTPKIEPRFILPDQTPLIGIVFLVLMFFMVGLSFENTKADERIKLPAHALAKPPVSGRDNELVLSVSFDQRNAGQAVVSCNGDTVTADQILPALEREAERYAGRAAGKPRMSLEDVTVIIRADANIPTGVVQELIENCQQAKFTKFSLQAQPQD